MTKLLEPRRLVDGLDGLLLTDHRVQTLSSCMLGDSCPLAAMAESVLAVLGVLGVLSRGVGPSVCAAMQAQRLVLRDAVAKMAEKENESQKSIPNLAIIYGTCDPSRISSVVHGDSQQKSTN